MPSWELLSTRVLACNQSFHRTAKPRSRKAESNRMSLEESRLLLSFLRSLSFFLCEIRSSLPVDSVVKNLVAMQKTQVRSPGQEDPLEKEMVTHSSILAGEFHGQRSLAGYIQSLGSQGVRHN